ncbi:unnamed protein product [Ambrosiozyma monospora]|uniref:Unnamed protein product n=1 Tax=Ambrosiozyma monospora TaxID=43982 RepID=A0ACB5U6T3_AMBMO|nr:unnamed protein product [Ambrosiozyma monospora]
MYTAMPLYHGTASILGVLPSIYQGGTLCLGYKFSLSSYWTQVKLTGANSIQYVGEVCRYLVDGPTTKDELFMKGKIISAIGNGLRPDIWTKFKDRFGIYAIGEFYAASESPFATTCYETNGVGIGCIRNYGWIASKVVKFEYNLVRMRDDDDNAIYRNEEGFCEEPSPNVKGELVTRVMNPKKIRNTFPGYINNDEATYSKVIRDVFKRGDCYVRSDDLMKFDEMGCLHFVDQS